MNKFLNKKKAAPEAIATNSDALSAVSSGTPPQQVSPGLKKSATSRWKRSKKQPEQKPAIDMATVLPSSDEFRTSLLMPNLSARFSMLREQDDPTSLLGKASDDSVLQPRRRSRMMDFGFSPNMLNDIAEVQSINGSIRKPWTVSRQDSFASEDGYGSENEAGGSVMSRARPGEGNTMFGGRQKVYKIAANGVTSTKSLGKPVYEDDIGMSAFQRFKQRERDYQQQSRQSEDSQGFDFGLDSPDVGDEDRLDAMYNDSAKDLTHSPSLSSYDKKRSTTSTARSEARSSTAATSVASQPINGAPSPLTAASQTPAAGSTLKRSDTKTKRLYEPGLDQHMHDQQSSAMTRLNSIQRQRTINTGKQSPPFLHNAKSASNLNDRSLQPVYSINGSSLPPTGPLPPLKTLGSLKMSNSSPMASVPQSPVSPDLDDADVLIQALEPGDRGKATAMGAFNKPKQAFDEQQYLERQQQLQRSQSRAGAHKSPDVAPSPFQQRIGCFEPRENERSIPSASARSRSRSKEPAQAYDMFQNAAGQFPTHAGVQQLDKSTLPDTHRTFFGNISASDSEEEEEEEQSYNQPGHGFGGFNGRWPNALPSVSEHPALRSQKSKASLPEEDEDTEARNLRTAASSRSLRYDAPGRQSPLASLDSPTLGPGAQPLNGMVHHLRQKSESSIYPEDSINAEDEVPEMPDMTAWAPKNLDLVDRPVRNTFETDSRVGSVYTHSNPWDLDEDNAGTANRESRGSISPIDSVRPPGPLSSRTPSSRSNAIPDRHSEVSQDSEGPNWQHELRKHHAREASSATQQERDAFSRELAARRNAIQENIKSIVERDTHSRGQSPGPAFKPFGILKSKSSRESVAMDAKAGASTKTTKMFGPGASANSSATNLSLQQERSGFSSEYTRQRNDSVARPPQTANGQQRSLHSSDWEPLRPRVDSETSRPDLPSSGRSPTSSQGRMRSRSNSAATAGRCRSRTGPYRDDLEKAMVEGTGSSAAGYPDVSPLLPRELTPRLSPDVTQPSQFDQQGRDRSGSRSAMTNYFDAKTAQPLPSPVNARMGASGQSSITLSPHVYTPNSSARPSPTVGQAQFTQSMTPPLSGPNTPATFSPLPAQYRPAGILRKKTISKSDISEPTLISSTSNVDTIDLPEGASLKNGSEAPPLPPINPRRRGTRKMFGLGRGDSGEDSPRSSEHEMAQDTARSSGRKTSGNENYMPRGVSKQSLENHSSPALLQQIQYGSPPSLGSPERVQRSPVPQASLEGGMF